MEIFESSGMENPFLNSASSDKAWNEMKSLPRLKDNLLAMSELVKKEVAANKFDFFYKLREKYIDIYMDGMVESDLVKYDPHWYLKI